MQHLPRFLEIKEIGKAEERRLRGLIRSDNTTLRESARKQVKVLDELAAHKQIREANQQGKEATEESRKDKIFGTVFAAMDKVRGRRREIKDDNLFSYYVMAEMEVFMWGEKSKETLQLIEDRERQIVEAEEVRKREAEERERQREEERRLREEERKRQDEEYLARQRQPQDPLHQPTTAANHPFWSQGGDETDSFQLPTEEKPDLLKSLMPPAAYEAYRNAQKIKEKPSYPVALPQGTER
jgi:septal ring factor EnvC (AmiA/AmiB activator)